MKKFIACLPLSIAYLAFWVFQSRSFYVQGLRPVTVPDNLFIHALALVAILVLVLGIRKGGFKKAKQLVLWVLLIVTSAGAVTALSFRTSFVRYQVVRYEVLKGNLGLSHREPGLRKELHEELLSRGVGPYIFRDEALLRKLVFIHGDQFTRRPVEARVAFAGLRNYGVDFNGIWDQPGTEAFLLSLLQSEADPEPWYGLEHLPEPEFSPRPEIGFHSGFLSKSEGRMIITKALAQKSTDREPLVFFASSFDDLFTKTELRTLFTEWRERFPEQQHLLEGGFRLREFLETRTGDQVSLAVTVELEEFFTPDEVGEKQLDRSIVSSITGLVRSCGKKVILTDPDEADLIIYILLGEMIAYEYEAPVYDLVTVRVPTRTRIGKISVSSSRKETRSKMVGSRTTAKFSASVMSVIEVVNDDDSVEQTTLDEMMVYWIDNFSAENRDRDPPPPSPIDWRRIYEQLNGRIWPLGIHEDYFRFPSVRGSGDGF